MDDFTVCNIEGLLFPIIDSYRMEKSDSPGSEEFMSFADYLWERRDRLGEIFFTVLEERPDFHRLAEE